MTGINLGTFSKSGSRPYNGNPIVIYNKRETFIPRHIRVRFKKNELISSFSQSYLKKLVL